MSIGLSKKLQLGRQGTQWIFVPSFATGEESLPSRASAPPPHPEQYRSDPHHGSCRPLASFEGDAIRRHHRMASQHQSRQRLVKAVANSGGGPKRREQPETSFLEFAEIKIFCQPEDEKTDKKSHHYAPYHTVRTEGRWDEKFRLTPTKCSKS